MASQDQTRISVLHATYQRPSQAEWVRRVWLRTAEHPERVQWVFAFTEDDVASHELITWEQAAHVPCSRVTTIQPEVVGEIGGSAVRNWNAAATVADGDVLVVCADDLTPPQQFDPQIPAPPPWDTELLRRIGDVTQPKVLAFGDGTGRRFIPHPVITRAWYQLFGCVFNPEYPGVFCDNELTLETSKRKARVDALDWAWNHEHPLLNKKLEWSGSHRVMNSRTAYEHGRAVWDRRNPGVDPVKDIWF